MHLLKRTTALVLFCFLISGSISTADARTIFGACFSPMIAGQNPKANPVTIGDEQILARLKLIAPRVTWISYYSSTLGLENTGRLAKSLGLGVAGGAWISTDHTKNMTELKNLAATCLRQESYLAIIGYEALLREDVSADQLVYYINYFKELVRDSPVPIPVVVADSYNELAANPSVVMASDAVLLNIYPYWEGIEITKAADYLYARYKSFQQLFPGKFVAIGETGWPSAGETKGAAVPSDINAAYYLLDVTSLAIAKGIYIFYFEALDEAWKILYEGEVGGHWGILDQNGNLKPWMEYIFVYDWLFPDRWSCQAIPGGNGTPQIVPTSYPSKGNTGNLEGQVLNISPSSYSLVVYIRVDGLLWVKPFSTAPITVINCDGKFSCPLATGGDDANATEIAVYAIRNTYTPPILLGSGSFPPELSDTNNVVASIHIYR